MHLVIWASCHKASQERNLRTALGSKKQHEKGQNHSLDQYFAPQYAVHVAVNWHFPQINSSQCVALL